VVERIQLDALRADIALAPGARVDIAGGRTNEDVSAVVGRDTRAVHIHVAVGGNGDVAGARREDALGRIGIAVESEFAADIQRSADGQLNGSVQTLVVNFGGGEVHIAGDDDIQVRAIRGDGGQGGIRRED
jgi:hypothetical protein